MAANTTFYLSRILGKRLYSEYGLFLGRILDIVVDIGYKRPKIVALVVRSANGSVMLDYKMMHLEENKGKYSMVCSVPIPYLPDESRCMKLKKSVLDRQIVDIDGRKVVRVNDLRLVVLADGAYLVAVDVGMEGLLRRLGAAKQITWLLKPFKIRIPNHLIMWDEVETVDTCHAGIRLSTEYSSIGKLHPSDVADIIESLDWNAQMAIFNSLDHEKAADVLEELDPKIQATMLNRLPLEHAADLLESMPSDEVADILDGLNEEKAQALLDEMEDEASDEVRELMEYPGNSVGSIMSKDYIAFNKNQTIEEVFAILREIRPESDAIYYLYIVNDSEQLMATVSIRDLIISSPSLRLSEIMNTEVFTVLDTDPINTIVENIDKYNLLAVPVTDISQKLVGIVIINDVVFNLIRARKRR